MTRAFALSLLLAAAFPFAACSDDASGPAPNDPADDDASVLVDTTEPGDDTAPTLPDATRPETDDDPARDTREEDAPDDSTNEDAVTEDADASPPPPRPIPTSVDDCFADIIVREGVGPSYDAFDVRIGRHCDGTQNQRIDGIERVVFAGDSVTVGTLPARPPSYYRTLLTERLRERFGEDLEVESVAQFGARTDDLLLPSNEQLLRAFPDSPDPRRTLVIMTVGGNDLFRWTEMHGRGDSQETILAMVDEAGDLMEDAIRWLVEPGRFPNGIFVVFANTYEFTDGTGDVTSCPIASAIGISEPWPEGQVALTRFNERFMAIAEATGTDMIFLLEAFCGHGFRRGTEDAVCDRGPEAPAFFDPTCIHPTVEGHARIADMFWNVITGDPDEAGPPR